MFIPKCYRVLHTGFVITCCAFSSVRVRVQRTGLFLELADRRQAWSEVRQKSVQHLWGGLGWRRKEADTPSRLKA